MTCRSRTGSREVGRFEDLARGFGLPADLVPVRVLVFVGDAFVAAASLEQLVFRDRAGVFPASVVFLTAGLREPDFVVEPDFRGGFAGVFFFGADLPLAAGFAAGFAVAASGSASSPGAWGRVADSSFA